MDRIDSLMQNPRKGLLVLATPIILSMVAELVLIIVDTYFIAGLGHEALAAMQLAFPIVFIGQAFAGGLSIGATSVISRKLGAGQKKEAAYGGANAATLAILMGVVMMVVVIPLAYPIIAAFGADAAVTAMASDYLWIIALCGIGLMFSMAANGILVGEGNTKTPLIIHLIGIVINGILDPIMIYNMDLGISGAAIATTISVIIMAGLFAYFIYFKRNGPVLDIRGVGLLLEKKASLEILTIGLPAAFAQMGLSMSMIIMNAVLVSFGSVAIAGLAIGFRVDSLVIMPMLGLGGAAVAMVGYFKGSNKPRDSLRVARFAASVNFIFGLGIGALAWICAPIFIGTFTSNPAVLEIGISYTRVIALTYCAWGVGITMSSSFQGMGRGMPSLAITLLRSLVLLLPLALVLPPILGISGVWIAMLISGWIAAVIAFLWFEFYLRREISKTSS